MEKIYHAWSIIYKPISNDIIFQFTLLKIMIWKTFSHICGVTVKKVM